MRRTRFVPHDEQRMMPSLSHSLFLNRYIHIYIYVARLSIAFCIALLLLHIQTCTVPNLGACKKPNGYNHIYIYVCMDREKNHCLSCINSTLLSTRFFSSLSSITFLRRRRSRRRSRLPLLLFFPSRLLLFLHICLSEKNRK